MSDDAASVAGPDDRSTHSSRVHRLRSDDITWTSTDQGVTVLDIRTARYMQLNRSGAVLWELLSDGASEDELVVSLCERFTIPADRARQDVRAFVDALTARDFLA